MQPTGSHWQKFHVIIFMVHTRQAISWQHQRLENARLQVEDEALQGEAEVGRHGAQAQLARGVHLGLAERAHVLVVALQPLLAQQRRLRSCCLSLVSVFHDQVRRLLST